MTHLTTISINPLTYLGTIPVDARRLPVVYPCIVEHEPHIIHILPRVCILAVVQLPGDGRQVHGLLDDVEIVRDTWDTGPNASIYHVCIARLELKIPIIAVGTKRNDKSDTCLNLTLIQPDKKMTIGSFPPKQQ